MPYSLIKIAKIFIVDSHSENKFVLELHNNAYEIVLQEMEANGARDIKLFENTPIMYEKLRKELDPIVNSFLVKINKKFPQPHHNSSEEKFNIGTYKIEILTIDRKTKDRFSFNLHLVSDAITVVEKFDKFLLLSVGDKSKELLECKEIDTFLFELNNETIISNFKRINV